MSGDLCQVESKFTSLATKNRDHKKKKNFFFSKAPFGTGPVQRVKEVATVSHDARAPVTDSICPLSGSTNHSLRERSVSLLNEG